MWNNLQLRKVNVAISWGMQRPNLPMFGNDGAQGNYENWNAHPASWFQYPYTPPVDQQNFLTADGLQNQSFPFRGNDFWHGGSQADLGVTTTAEASDVGSRDRGQRRKRSKYNENQLCVLEREFAVSPYISPSRCRELSASVDMSERQIKNWFQNKRCILKKKDGKKEENPRPADESTPVPTSLPQFATERAVAVPPDLDTSRSTFQLPFGVPSFPPPCRPPLFGHAGHPTWSSFPWHLQQPYTFSLANGAPYPPYSAAPPASFTAPQDWPPSSNPSSSTADKR